jgi:proteic killer suppression protein
VIVIESFRHKGLKKLYFDADRSGIAPQSVARITMILSMLETAESAEELNLPGLRLHKLSGNRKDTYSLTVRANWRITFRFEDGSAYDVDLEDYH